MMEQSPNSSSSVLTRTDSPRSWDEGVTPRAHFLVGRKAILSLAPELREFAERCGQPGSLNWLDYFLGGAGKLWKRPWLVLFLHPGSAGQPVSPENIHGCAFYCELTLAGIGTGVFLTEDWGGLRGVIGYEPDRAEIAAWATEALFTRGSSLVVTTYASSDPNTAHRATPVLHPDSTWSFGARENGVQRLTLEPDWDAQLAKFGKKTRDNLRYYRKRLGAEVGCEFVPDALSEMSQSEYEALNRASLNPVPHTECRRRYNSLRNESGSFLVGVRTSAGEWLSVLGGWRQDSTTVMHHQMNRAGYDRYSLVHVMRSFFLEEEIRRGARSVVFYHGTNHSMTGIFDLEHLSDLVAVRLNSFRVRLLRLCSRWLAGDKNYRESVHFGGTVRFLGAVLWDKSFQWEHREGAARTRGSDRCLNDRAA